MFHEPTLIPVRGTRTGAFFFKRTRNKAKALIFPPLIYDGFLKRNEDALLIPVVGGGQTPTTAGEALPLKRQSLAVFL